MSWFTSLKLGSSQRQLRCAARRKHRPSKTMKLNSQTHSSCAFWKKRIPMNRLVDRKVTPKSANCATTQCHEGSKCRAIGLNIISTNPKIIGLRCQDQEQTVSHEDKETYANCWNSGTTLIHRRRKPPGWMSVWQITKQEYNAIICWNETTGPTAWLARARVLKDKSQKNIKC